MSNTLCINSLSSAGLQQLLNICYGYSELHDLTFNAKKSMCMYLSTSRKAWLMSCNLSRQQAGKKYSDLTTPLSIAFVEIPIYQHLSTLKLYR